MSFLNDTGTAVASAGSHRIYDNGFETTISSNYTLYTTNALNGSNETVPDYACHMPSRPDVKLSHDIYVFGSLFFVVIGLVGNGLSIGVFSSKGMRVFSSNVYLLMLAVSDSMYLIVVFLTKILTTLRCKYFRDTHADIVNRHDFACVLLQYMQDLFSDYSACLIMAFTVERYIACYHPMKFKDICTVKRARFACFLILMLIGVFICPYHIMYIGRHAQFGVCIVLEEFESEFTILYVVEALIFRIGPVFIIAVLNVFIISKVSKVHAERKRRHAVTARANNNNRNQQQDKHMQLTVMLILVSSTYIVLYLPVLVHFVMWKLQRGEVLHIAGHTMDLIQNYTRVLYIMGFAINFFLYTMSGKVFRDQLELILCDARVRKKLKAETETADEKQTLV